MRAKGAFTLLLLTVAVPATVVAQYPQRPITLLVGYGSGSASDLTARRLAEAATKHLRQPIIVVNRPGAGATIAISEAVTAEPDGYTLAFATMGPLALQPHQRSLSYYSPDTYIPVAKLTSDAAVLMVRAGAPWRTLQEFLNYARAHPGELTIGVPGDGTTPHINVEQLKMLAKVDLKVAFYDAPKQVDAALAGQIDAAMTGHMAAIPHAKAGKGLLLAVASDHRMLLAPEVQTFKDFGLDITLGNFAAIIAPKGTPAAIVRTLGEVLRQSVTEFAEATGNMPDYKGREAFAVELRRVFEENRKLIQELGRQKN